MARPLIEQGGPIRFCVTPTRAIAVGAVFIAMSGTAVAANGGNLILGKGNKARSTTTLTSTKSTPLSLAAPAGKAPLAVSNSVKVGKLNADLLDGLDSTALRSATVLYRD